MDNIQAKKYWRIKIVLIASLMLLGMASKSQNMQDQIGKYKVVIQLSSNDTLVHKAVVNNINNILKAFDKVNIELVAHGPGIEFLLKTSIVKNSIELLHHKRITFIACQNTLTTKNIAQENLLPFCSIVNSGIAHIIKRQAEGWSYIKSGF